MKHKSIQNFINSTSSYKPKFRLVFLLPKYWLIWLVALFLWLISFFPWYLRSAIAKFFTSLSYWAMKKRRKIALRNLSLCFKDYSALQLNKILKQHFYARVRIVLDYGFLWFRSTNRLNKLLRIENEQLYKQYYDAGKPVIFLSCHTLALDFGATGLTLKYPGVGLVKPAKNDLVDWFMQRGRTRFNAVLYARKYGIRPITKAVKQGVFFYYLPDEDIQGKDSIFSPFFGIQALTLTTLRRLAEICDAEVLPSVTYYEFGRGYYVNKILPALDLKSFTSPEQDALILNQTVEKLILLQPAQYMWFMKRFNRRPTGEADLYN